MLVHTCIEYTHNYAVCAHLVATTEQQQQQQTQQRHRVGLASYANVTVPLFRAALRLAHATWPFVLANVRLLEGREGVADATGSLDETHLGVEMGKGFFLLGGITLNHSFVP